MSDSSFWGYEVVNGRTFGGWLRAARRNDDNVRSAAAYQDLRTAWLAGAKPSDYTADKF